MSAFPTMPEEGCQLHQLCTTPTEDTTRLRYDCSLITPMYGGGVEPGQVDLAMPIRATAIRGHLRFWWRIVTRERGNAPSTFQRERDLWGGLSTQNEQEESGLKASTVLVRVTQDPKQAVTETSTRSYAYGPASNNPSVQWLSAGYAWTMDIECPKAQEEEIKKAVQWWATFGGVGSRTRRGFGAIRIEGVASVVPKDKLHDCTLKLGSKRFDTAVDAWVCAYKKLYEFRQGNPVGRTRKFGRSCWPEPDAIRNLTSHSPRHPPLHPHLDTFPRAQFGLPLIFKFKDQDVAEGDPQTTTLVPKDAERYASPLIIRPYFSSQTNKWHPLALLLPNWSEDFPLELKHTHDGHSLLPPGTHWSLSKSTASQVAPLATRGSDALSAFMAFFAAPPQPAHNAAATHRAAPPAPPPPPKPTTTTTEAVSWGKVRVQRNRANGALSAQHPETAKTATATGEAAKALFNELGAEIQKKFQERGACNLLVTVQGGDIKQLEVPAP